MASFAGKHRAAVLRVFCSACCLCAARAFCAVHRPCAAHVFCAVRLLRPGVLSALCVSYVPRVLPALCVSYVRRVLSVSCAAYASRMLSIRRLHSLRCMLPSAVPAAYAACPSCVVFRFPVVCTPARRRFCADCFFDAACRPLSGGAAAGFKKTPSILSWRGKLCRALVTGVRE